MAELRWGFTRVQCVFPACVSCFVTVFVHSFASYHRAIWDAEECSLSVSASACFNLPQGESICHDGGGGAAAVVVLMPFSSSFYHWMLSLQCRMEELAYISTCSTLILTCYLSLIVVFHRDIFGTKTSTSPGWCTHRHTHTAHTLSNTVLNILPVLLVPHPLWAWCLWCSIPTMPTTPQGLFLSLIGPGSLLYKKTLEQFSCRLLNF